MRAATRSFIRPIAVVVEIIFALSFIVIFGSILAGHERFGGFIVTALALDHWYPPVMSATPDQLNFAYQAVFSLALAVFTFCALVWFLVWIAAKSVNGYSGIADGFADLIEDIFHLVRRRPAITRAERKALDRVASRYDDQGRFGRGMEAEPEITPDDLPTLLARIADEERQYAFYDGYIDYTEKFTREAIREIAEGTNYPALNAPYLRGRQTKTALDWLASRGIYTDLSLGLAFIPRGTFDPALFTHVIATLNAAQDSVLAVPAGTAEWVLRKRSEFETQADALSVARGYYHDDEIPETKDEIICWALAVVEEGVGQ